MSGYESGLMGDVIRGCVDKRLHERMYYGCLDRLR